MLGDIFAIDFGTTRTCCAVWNPNTNSVDVVQDISGERLTPSVVNISAKKTIVGTGALALACTDTKNTIFGMKRIIGLKCDDEDVINDIKMFPFSVFPDENGLPVVSAGNNKYIPEEIVSMIFKNAKENVARYGIRANNVIITVPVYFNDSQRSAIINACKLADLNVIRIINEPTAASIAFGVNCNSDEKRNVCVFDFGGGTLDAAIVTITPTEFSPKASSGRPHLGGEDLDRNIMNYLAEIFIKINGEENDPLKQPRSRALLRKYSEDAKNYLSFHKSCSVLIPGLINGIDLNITITRECFNSICAQQFQICEECLNDLFDDFDIGELTDVVLVGGCSRIPAVRGLIKDYFRDYEVSIHTDKVDPDEAIAIGAAHFAHQYARQSMRVSLRSLREIDGTEEEDVEAEAEREFSVEAFAEYPISLKHGDNQFLTVIKRGDKLPIKREIAFEPIDASKNAATLKFFECDPSGAKENLIMKCCLDNLPSRPPKNRAYKIVVSEDLSGLVSVRVFIDGKELEWNLDRFRTPLQSPRKPKVVKDPIEIFRRKRYLLKKQFSKLVALAAKEPILEKKKCGYERILRVYETEPETEDDINKAIENLKTALMKISYLVVE